MNLISKNKLSYAVLLFTLIFTAACTSASSSPTPNPEQTQPEAPPSTNTPTPAPPTATPVPTETLVPALPSGESVNTLLVDGMERSYRLYIPPGLSRQQSVPVVFAFHNYTSVPNTLRDRSNLNSIADQVYLLVVYPKGVGQSWNTGEIGPGEAIEQNIDESKFVQEMLADLGTIANIDHDRIYALGFGMGGALAYRLACEMSETFAAIASVSGAMEYDACNPKQSVSVLHFHGLDDRSAPFSGGGFYNLPPVLDGFNIWLKSNECTGPPAEEKLNETINRTMYSPCQNGTVMELYTHDTAGHSWPDWFPNPASEYIWEFFAAHPKP